MLESLFYLNKAKLITHSYSNPDVISFLCLLFFFYDEQWFIILAKDILYNKLDYLFKQNTKNVEYLFLYFQSFIL